MLQSGFERIVLCDILPWPDCGWPANSFTAAPTPSQAAKPPRPNPTSVQDLNSVRFILVNKEGSLQPAFCGFYNQDFDRPHETHETFIKPKPRGVGKRAKWKKQAENERLGH